MLIQVLMIVVAVGGFYYFRRIKRTNLPPGPPFSLPIFGHLLYLGDNPTTIFQKWTKRYGPVFTVQLGSYTAIVINEGQLIRKAFNMSSLAGRPDLKYINAFDEQHHSFLSSDGPNSTEKRKFLQKLLKNFDLNKSNSGPILDHVLELLEVFEDHLSKPLSVKQRFNNIIVNDLWSIVAAGDRVDKDNNEHKKFTTDMSNLMQMSSPIEKLSFFIKFIPDCFPELSGFNKKIRGVLEIQNYLARLINEHARTKLENQPRDFIDAYLDKVETTTDPQSAFFPDHANITIAMQDIFNGGSETANTLEWILFYLAKYPNVQEKFQKEINTVIGSNRMPCSDDQAKLHYVQAVMEEVSRIASIAPLSFFHSAMEDTEFNGFTIPKGMIVVGNLYSAHHDKNIWGDPEVFRPERFLDGEGNFSKSNDVMAFSCGKRSCIGYHLATLQLFLYTVSIFQRFSVKPVGELPPESGMFGLSKAVYPFQLVVSKHGNEI